MSGGAARASRPQCGLVRGRQRVNGVLAGGVGDQEGRGSRFAEKVQEQRRPRWAGRRRSTWGTAWARLAGGRREQGDLVSEEEL